MEKINSSPINRKSALKREIFRKEYTRCHDFSFRECGSSRLYNRIWVRKRVSRSS